MAKPAKVTAYHVQNAIKAGVGRRESLQLTDADRAEIAATKQAQTERLARIAARAASKKA